MTIGEYARLRDDPRYQDELVRGQLVREPRPGSRHGWIVMRLGHFLLEHVEPLKAGVVMTETGIVLQHEPPTVRGPDLSFVVAGRLPGLPADEYLRVAPDLVAEVLSPTDRAPAMAAKVAEYVGAGVRLVWVVDPKRRRVTVHRPGAPPRALEGDAVLSGDEVIPGFAVALERLFG